ncbi:peptidoglycan-binding domain-containing protein [Streptomyces sp. URMC 129]|uniref:peptidoglycan-binding domain-containing protein n=1 Tax=Streptomyces sp. URMC 129 TaxID=3423407 RepID=UPI003F1C15DE
MTDWMPREHILRPVTEAEREAVKTAQRALGVAETGELDDATKASLRGIQRLLNLPVTGVLDRATAGALERLRPPGLRD